MKSGKLLLGVLAGVAAGVVIGVLLAPDKGSETRKKIFKKGADYADDLKDTFNEFVDSLADKFEKVTNEATDVAENERAKEEKNSI